MNSDLPIIKFNPKLPRLSEGESRVLKLLVEAAELIAPLYQKQEEDAKLVSKEEVEIVSKEDSTILLPYTAIVRKNGKLTALPYHIIYVDYLKPIAEKLKEAEDLTDNKEFGNLLHIQAKALLDGTYEDVTIASLKMKPYILDISIGPLNHFDDRLFYGKASYSAWVGVMDEEGTDRLNNYKDIVLSTRRISVDPKYRIDDVNVKARVNDVILFSGLMAVTKFVGINLPMDLNLVEKYGSEITLFNQPNDLRLKEYLLPTFNKIFGDEFKNNYSDEDLRRGYLRMVAMHEFAHSFLYYKNAEKNLLDLFPSIYELAATVLGFRISGSLLLKDRITNKQLESMMLAFICRTSYISEESKNNKSLKNYGLMGSIFINYLIENGALKEYKGRLIPNFTKIFLAIHELSDILEKILASGSRQDAESLIAKYTI